MHVQREKVREALLHADGTHGRRVVLHLRVQLHVTRQVTLLAERRVALAADVWAIIGMHNQMLLERVAALAGVVAERTLVDALGIVHEVNVLLQVVLVVTPVLALGALVQLNLNIKKLHHSN